MNSLCNCPYCTSIKDGMYGNEPSRACIPDSLSYSIEVAVEDFLSDVPLKNIILTMVFEDGSTYTQVLDASSN